MIDKKALLLYSRSFSGTMKSLADMKWDIKLSSAGLVYLHFGKDVLSQLMKTSKDDSRVELIYAKVYENFVQEIDAIDNGVNQFDGEPRYSAYYVECILLFIQYYYSKE